MEAIRQYLKVKGRTLEVVLPDDFIADEVEVIVLAKDGFELTEEMKATLNERLNEPAEGYITSEDSLNRLKKRNGL
ncbi:hypothetical protein CHU92_03555 [Flavobacterium cyanobacteriorum]|uniref:Uncharacterized protein n=1 Tax=Flavobacterium cyanobacteriorum TaxID=2022802 RepID=A0A255ZQU7_9FLAO|nr:hypothetical protein [Flavobacterium cyanobacteriorum]OYQ43284.1 hypothetical protein CHU92_03555 [Flavobacterium cyanobacteriorum]